MPNYQPTLFESGNPDLNSVSLHDSEITGPDVLNRWERLEVLQHGPGFFPTTTDELDEAMSTWSFQGTPGKTATHLNEILRHQQKANTDKPQQAVRSVVSEYDSYARRSQTDQTQLLVLKEDIKEFVNPKVSLGEELGERFNGGVRQFVRYVDLHQYFESRGEVQPGFDILKKADRARQKDSRIIIDQYSASELTLLMKKHMTEVLQSTSVKDSRQLIESAIEDQKNRFSFWADRLRESRAHSLAKPIAERALWHLGVEES